MLSHVALVSTLAIIAFLIAYLVIWNASQIVMSQVAAIYLWSHQRSNTRRARALVGQTVSRPLVSIVMPAYNEGVTIVESVLALLALNYGPLEIVVVNDGSTDDTLTRLKDTFHLLPAPRAFVQPLASAPVRGLYRSTRHPGLVVIDKQNGKCKADAANAGINTASGSLVAIIDADTILDRHALTRAITTLLEDPTTVAIGANVGIVNGCRVRDGRVEEISLPRNWWARFQIVEYMRSFFLFRLACASCNGVVIISGAFGLFRRDAVIAVGGYDTTAVGEDMDLTVRLQRHFRELGQRFRIAFDPNPLAWTQAPEDWRSLRSQRYRWRRGLLQVLWRNRHMIGNPRYGVIGMAVLPYAALFEGLAPLLELAGYVVLILGAVSGTLTPHVSLVAFAVSVLAGTGITFAAVVLSDLGTRRYMRGRELLLLIVVVFVENCGYRQLNSWWGCVGTYQTLTGKGGWGEMKRKAFEGA